MSRIQVNTEGGIVSTEGIIPDNDIHSSASRMQYSIINDWYKAVIQNATEGFFLADLKCNILYVNDAYCRMLGYSRAELLTMNSADVIIKTPAELKKFNSNVQKTIIEGDASFEIKSRRKDSRIIELAVSYKYMDVGPGFIFCVHRDITEQKEINKQLIESEERYHALVALGGRVGEAVVIMQDVKTLEGVQTFASDEWIKITGYSRQELLGIPFFDLLKSEYYSASLDRYRRKLRGETIPGPFEMELPERWTTIDIELPAFPCHLQGKRANVLISGISLTQESRKSRKESESRLQSFPLSVQSSDWVYVYDREGKFYILSSGAC